MVKYKVHRLGVREDSAHLELEKFLNSLKGQVISIVPEIRRYLLCQGAKVTAFIVVEKVKRK
jgi:hypothetical protein